MISRLHKTRNQFATLPDPSAVENSVLSYMNDAENIPDNCNNNNINNGSQSLYAPNSPKEIIGDSIFGHTELIGPNQGSSYMNHASSAFTEGITNPSSEEVNDNPSRGVHKTKDVASRLEDVSRVDGVILWKRKATYLDIRLEAEENRKKKHRERPGIDNLKSTTWGKVKLDAESNVESNWLGEGVAPGYSIEQLEHGQTQSGFMYELEQPSNMWGMPLPRKKESMRVTLWPSKPKQHFKLKYTWLPQPMVRSAVEKVYYNEGSDAAIPSISNSSVQQKLPSNLFDPSFVPHHQRKNQVVLPEKPRNPNKMTTQKKINTIMSSNMNSLSVISSVTDYDGGMTIHSNYSRAGSPQKKTKDPSNGSPITNGRPDHPYHWL